MMCFQTQVLAFALANYFTSATTGRCRTLPGVSHFQSEVRDTIPDSRMPNRSTVCRLVNTYRDTGALKRTASDVRKTANAGIAEND